MGHQSKLFQSGRRLAIFGLWTALGVFFATKLVMERRLVGAAYSWTKALWWQLMEWYIWGLLAMAVFWFCSQTYQPGQNWTRYGVQHLFAGLATSALQGTLCTVGGLLEVWLRGWPLTPVGAPYSFPVALRFTIVNHLHFNLLVYAGLVIAWHAARHYREVTRHELQAAALETQLARAQLQALRTQLQPHFLFNTLNATAELIHSHPQTAEEMILRLSALLRSTLESRETQDVSLGEEIELLKKYVEIQQVRLGDRLSVEWDVPAETLCARVPSLLLQPLVENAIEHGIAPSRRHGRMVVRAHRDNGTLLLQVRDDGPGWNGSLSSAARKGIGLANTESRLRHLYGPGRMELINDQGLVVKLSLPFIVESPPSTELTG
jgi:two-component sensor histidine kinase